MTRTSNAPRLLAASAIFALGCGGTHAAPAEYPRLPAAETAPLAHIETLPLRRAPRVIERPSESAIVTVRVAFDAGSADDPAGQEGITALAASMLLDGGAGDLDASALRAALFPIAADVSVSSSRDQTVVVGRVHRDHLDRFYELFREVLLRPRMDQASFDRLRQRASSELVLELRGNDDETLGKELLQSMIFEGHPYGHPELGTETSLAALSLDDVRAQRDHVFCAGRATIGIAGGYPAGFVDRVTRDVSTLSGEGCVGRTALPTPTRHGARVVLIDKPDASSTAVSMGFATDVVRGHADYAALTLVSAYLGQHRQFIGQLMQEIRERRGLNYGDYAYAEHFDQDGWGTFPSTNVARRQQYVSFWLRPLQPEQAHFAIRLALHELRRVVAEGLTEAEIDRTRRYLRGYYALFLQTESRRLGYAIDDAFYGEERAWLDRLTADLDALTVEQVNAVIRRHLELDRLEIAIVAPRAAAFADTLAAETPSPMSYGERTMPEEVLTRDRAVSTLEIGIPRSAMRVVPLGDVFH